MAFQYGRQGQGEGTHTRPNLSYKATLQATCLTFLLLCLFPLLADLSTLTWCLSFLHLSFSLPLLFLPKTSQEDIEYCLSGRRLLKTHSYTFLPSGVLFHLKREVLGLRTACVCICYPLSQYHLTFFFLFFRSCFLCGLSFEM